MWIAARLSTDRLDVWLHHTGNVTLRSATLAPDEGFEQALIRMIETDLPRGPVTPVLCAGVNGGSFSQVPCTPFPLHRVPCTDPRLSLYALPCLAQETPADLMQGQEAAIAGFLSAQPEWDGILCLTGHATRWVHISAGEVVSFRSFMTGEILDFLTHHASLRTAFDTEDRDDAVFETALSDAMSRPERFAATLCEIHAEAVLQRAGPAQRKARLLGTVIGIELAASRPYWLGRDVALTGDAPLLDHYAMALRQQGVVPKIFDETDLVHAGFAAAFAKVEGH